MQVFLNGSPSLFFEARFLNETQSSKIWLVLLAGFWGIPPSLPLKAGITGGYHTSRTQYLPEF